MASSYDLESGYVIAEKYRVERQLGEGGMGQVYLVQHVKTDERFALKILNPDVAKTPSARERFRREARTPARIDSDHVARVVDSDIAEDLGEAPFLVMEYLRGENLQDLSDELGPLPAPEVLVYLRQVAIALDKAHSIGIVHRDLKPENLFLTTRDDGTPCVKVLDFGIAKLSGATGDLAKVKATATGDIFGTPMYMSPEQCKSEAEKICAQSDIWAFGLIAYRLLTGDDFWTANTLTHLIAQIAYEPMPKASDRGKNLGPNFDRWFEICCNREVDARFATASEAVDAFAEAMGLDAGGVARPSAPMMAAARAQPGSSSTSDPSVAPTLAAEDTSTSQRLVKTSEALTLDTVDPGSLSGERSRSPMMIAGIVGVLLLAGGLAWLVGGFGGSGPAVGTTSSAEPTSAPTAVVTSEPTAEQTTEPTAEATAEATVQPTAEPTATASIA
ncbi:MAG TPA: hypothetical protein ENK57_21290, partial [Polyangiaceae bacterium]|nr:hypothetical protein [Polyangiaceae bacterium]